MPNYKAGKWAHKILSLQNEDGSWGYFHTLSATSDKPYTTEQALRRLEVLGFTIEDACIKRIVDYMSDCLLGKNDIPDRVEKSCDWNVFRDLMLATWIRRFIDENEAANKVASLWANIIVQAFKQGRYSHEQYIESYQTTFGNKPHGGRLTDFVSFYQVSLLQGELDKQTESLMFDYILNKKDGIYYIYENCITSIPSKFQNKSVSRYLGAVELLCGYKNNAHKLEFIGDWLEEQRIKNSVWDMGAVAKDNVYFPLSDRWDSNSRIIDCTYRIENILKKIKAGKDST